MKSEIGVRRRVAVVFAVWFGLLGLCQAVSAADCRFVYPKYGGDITTEGFATDTEWCAWMSTEVAQYGATISQCAAAATTLEITAMVVDPSDGSSFPTYSLGTCRGPAAAANSAGGASSPTGTVQMTFAPVTAQDYQDISSYWGVGIGILALIAIVTATFGFLWKDQ